MATGRASSGVVGLEEASGPRVDRIRSLDAGGGVELMRAWFAGRAYAKHRHDSYAIGVTDVGVQAFDYRGVGRISTPGRIVVLHPDEPHDGRAGSAEGFGYRIVYVPPRRVAEAARAICGAAVPLPFVADAVAANPLLERAIAAAFLSFPAALEPLAVDALVEGLARGLVAADRSVRRMRRRLACDLAAIDRARQFLEAERTRVVASDELERVSGHDRFSLARQFRQVCGTSPYRYLLMRRLDLVRGEIRAGRKLAGIAFDAGFADQAHMTRVFGAAFGMSPAEYRAALTRGSARPTPRARRP
jgi:AraC-like DNA-binding protein